MLLRTCNPQLMIKEKDLPIVQEKMLEFGIEKISTHTRENTIIIHIYGEKINVDRLLHWLENEINIDAEVEE